MYTCGKKALHARMFGTLILFIFGGKIMYDLSQYYEPIELDDGMVRIYGKPHVTDLQHLDSICRTSPTAAYYFISSCFPQY